jgi:hypothetical protein
MHNINEPSADQHLDPLYIVTHDPAHEGLDSVQEFLACEDYCCTYIEGGTPLPYRSTGSTIADWIAFYDALGLDSHQPFLRDVFALLNTTRPLHKEPLR